MPAASWTSLEPSVEAILAEDPNPIKRLADGDVAALIVRQAFPAAECNSLVRFLIEQELMYETGDERIEAKALDIDRADKYTKQGLNPKTSHRRRIDIGTSLGNLGDDKEHFLNHAIKTHALFDQPRCEGER